ncbi:hypothetical protein N7495_000100 [Penicillium taxi]|uniref:uncharacterized protein n=1 Tax=Penicillium taxi TaxID=168475 RepID=UPI0025457918|nr:uncharacterized protein N7495_000100 [Penicillium taxi]KAJ5907418.1 hypothetical protein N7495_000100 [Penicillium taxi]
MSKRLAEFPLEGVLSPKKARLKYVDNNSNDQQMIEASEEDVLQDAVAAQDNSDLSDTDKETAVYSYRQNKPLEGFDDLYLDTVNRAILDFDFEKLCSVSLVNYNVYACLVCSKYFQGRGPKSYAYHHAVDTDHHVFINLSDQKVWILPEGYEVKSSGLDDIKFVLEPHYTKRDLMKLDSNTHGVYDFSNNLYRPGFVGMNNIKANDYFNVVIQILSHVTPLRNFFLCHEFPTTGTPELALRFSTLVRKLWNPKAFRSHVSPQELLQYIGLVTSRRFTSTKQADPVEFLSWLLNNLHQSLGGSKKLSTKRTTAVQFAFQGQMRVESQAITAQADDRNERLTFIDSDVIESKVVPFFMLTLDLPPTPLFQSAVKDDIVPQVSLSSLLRKYSGRTATERASNRVRHRLIHPLPPYLIFHVKRFTSNIWLSERNPTIVTHASPDGLNMAPYVEPNPDVWPPSEPIFYDLVSSITLDTSLVTKGNVDDAVKTVVNPTTGAKSTTVDHKVAWVAQIRDKAVDRENARQDNDEDRPNWYEIQDLSIRKDESEIIQTLFTKETYLMVWERRKVPGKGKGPASEAN